MKRLLLFTLLSAFAMAQDKKFKYSVCVGPIAAYGSHVRFTPEEHLKIVQNQHATDREYREWENASWGLDWFSGKQPVSLAYVKKHMPRAMLLSIRFPVNQNPPVDPDGLKDLLAAEKAYLAAQKVLDDENYSQQLMTKYGIGPGAIFDPDMGGAKPMSGCGKYEERTSK